MSAALSEVVLPSITPPIVHTFILQLLSTTFVVFYLPDLPICTIQESGLSAMSDRQLYGTVVFWTVTRIHSRHYASSEFERISEGLSDALDFSRTIGADVGDSQYESGGGKGDEKMPIVDRPLTISFRCFGGGGLLHKARLIRF